MLPLASALAGVIVATTPGPLDHQLARILAAAPAETTPACVSWNVARAAVEAAGRLKQVADFLTGRPSASRTEIVCATGIPYGSLCRILKGDRFTLVSPGRFALAGAAPN